MKQVSNPAINIWSEPLVNYMLFCLVLGLYSESWENLDLYLKSKYRDSHFIQNRVALVVSIQTQRYLNLPTCLTFPPLCKQQNDAN